MYQFLEGKQRVWIITQLLLLQQKNLEGNTSKPRRLTCASKFNTIVCLSVFPFWKSFVFKWLTLNSGALETYQGYQFLILFESFPWCAGGKTRRKDSLLQLRSHRGSVLFLASLRRNCWNALPSSSRLELFDDTSSSFNCFKLTLVIVLKLSPSCLKIGASFFIRLALITNCSIMRQKY